MIILFTLIYSLGYTRTQQNSLRLTAWRLMSPKFEKATGNSAMLVQKYSMQIIACFVPGQSFAGQQ